MAINFNDLDKVTFDGTVYNEVTKASDNTSAITQDNSNVTYDNFLLHSSKEWLSTLESTATELIKTAKDTADKIKGDSKVIGAVKKAAPDGGAINFISSTAVNTVTGAINITADMGMSTSSPSITTTSNVNVTNAATNINYSDTIFNKTDRDITVTNQQLTSASDKHAVVTNTNSRTSNDDKTSAVNSHQVITNEQKQYSKALTTLTSESITIASKGNTSINSQGGLVISDGQSLKSGASQASFDTPESIGGTTDGGVVGNATEIPGAALGSSGSIKILSTGQISTQATGGVYTQADTVASNSSKFAIASIDTSLNSTTTTIASKVQSVLTSEAITYTGNRNMGISINPFGILVGTGVAPLIPLLTELLPPIIVDVPELPEFPFGSLADFLSKCLPFTSAIDLGSNTTTNPTATIINDPTIDKPIEIIDEGLLTPSTAGVDLTPLDTSFDPLNQSKGNVDEPVDISLENPLVSQDKSNTTPSAVKGVVSQQVNRDVTATPNSSTTNNKDKPATFTSKQAVTNAAKLGILHTVYAEQPGVNLNPKTTPTISTSDIASITPKLSYTESLKSLTSLQQSEIVNSFNPSVKTNISSNYSDFLKSVAIIDVFGPTTSPDYSKTVNDFLSNNTLVKEITTFLNTKRPIGVGGQQPPNIQNYDTPANLGSTVDGGFVTNSYIKTPPVIGQGLIDLATWAANTSTLAKSSIPPTTEDWFNPEDEDFDNYDFEFGDELLDNSNLASVSELLNNKYIDLAKSVIPDSKIQSALSLTQDIAAGKITTPQQYANRLASLVGGEVGGYISYAEQAFNIYDQVQAGNYTSLLGIPGVSNVLGSKGTAVASKVLSLIGKKNITDKDLYDVAGSIFTALTGIGIPLLDELAKLLGCIDSIKEQQPFLQSISNPDLQDIIDYLPRIIQTTKDKKVLNITPSNCGQISELSAEEATINVTEVGPSYIKFKLDNKDLISYNNHPLPTIGTPVNVYTEFYSDRITNAVLLPYKVGSQFTSNIIEYRITNKTGDIYTATLINTTTVLILEDNISGSLYQYTTADIGNRLAPYILDSYILL
jgi:hypothetical protein